MVPERDIGVEAGSEPVIVNEYVWPTGQVYGKLRFADPKQKSGVATERFVERGGFTRECEACSRPPAQRDSVRGRQGRDICLRHPGRTDRRNAADPRFCPALSLGPAARSRRPAGPRHLCSPYRQFRRRLGSNRREEAARPDQGPAWPAGHRRGSGRMRERLGQPVAQGEARADGFSFVQSPVRQEPVETSKRGNHRRSLAPGDDVTGLQGCMPLLRASHQGNQKRGQGQHRPSGHRARIRSGALATNSYGEPPFHFTTSRT